MRNLPAKSHIGNLVKYAQDGDTIAFAKLYQYFVQRLYRFCYVRIGSHEDTEDIISETWKTIWLNLQNYKQGNFQGYIFRIAYTKLIDYARKIKKSDSIEDFGEITSRSISAEQSIEQKEEIRMVRQSINKLPKSYAAIIVLRWIEGFSVKETANILNKSSIVVRVTQHRAMRKLKQIIKDYES